MNICFIMYPWDRISNNDTTLRIIHEAYSRGHNVGVMVPSNLTVRANEVFGFVRLLQSMEKVPADPVKFRDKVQFKEKMLPISGFDAIFLRANPPVDTTMLNFLDAVKDDVFFINDIDGIRKANNKLYTATMFDGQADIIPRTYVSKNKDYLLRMIQESNNEKMILKPLDGFGGSGVIVLEKKASQSMNSLLDFYISGQKGIRDHKYVIIQEYIEEADKGDVRVLMLNGKPIGAMKRVPAENDVRSNIHAGGREEKHSLTKAEKRICDLVGPKLVADGLYFVGLDIINGKLIEVNVLSPGGITRINRLNRTKLQTKVIDFVEDVIKIKESALNRRMTHRMTVQNAKNQS
ncbi:glutathione synthase [Persicobacter sp. CCB-QB2]|uniref:glutathione synthase n=1 Tax=Persicobacter sp. CCB-QB2 TaxID=1561025 RepID=UPI0006A9DBAD|nr:glutathione synthase [Persicobacter sp. CCB-QB2]